MYICKYSSDHLVVQFWSVVCTANELPPAFRTNVYFVVPEIAFLA
jgi:hypothetical protein